jgi:hypothetical protein
MHDDQKQPVSPEREGGHPGTGAGRRDEPGKTGVYPFNSDTAPDDAEEVVAGRWGQDAQGSYQDHGDSELSDRPERGDQQAGDRQPMHEEPAPSSGDRR